jgi:hypothetical protein
MSIVTDDPESYRLQSSLFDGGHVFSCHRLCYIVDVPVVIHACSMHNSCWGRLERLGQNVFHSWRSLGYESDEHVLASQFDDAVSIVPRQTLEPMDSDWLMTVHACVADLVAHQREWVALSRHAFFHREAWLRRVFVASR